MAQPEENPEYISELKKLVNDKVISEMTAQIHLSDINKNPNVLASNGANKRQQNPLISPEKFRNRRIMFAALMLSAAVVIFLLIR